METNEIEEHPRDMYRALSYESVTAMRLRKLEELRETLRQASERAEAS